ncbi:MORN repeat-containing protein [Planoprotostelium fungivorum]|uniref:MORN repeat-containing protein n=1 Tax=Planoprotostelium fungivorum TaxID=1890364 RepID=A0A2P6NZG8_9EUKA|nr:MORN repeat-containing protein [Planoprotostelium fungivorum]
MLSLFRVISPEIGSPGRSPISSPIQNWRRSSAGRVIFGGVEEKQDISQVSVGIISITDTYTTPARSSSRRVVTSVVKRDFRSSQDAMEVDDEFIFGAEGRFAVLPDEMRIHIFTVWAEEGDWKTLATAYCFNPFADEDQAWRMEFERRSRDGISFTTDEKLWVKLEVSWKWVCIAMTTPIEDPTAGSVMKLGYNAHKRSPTNEEDPVKFDGVYEGQWKAEMRHGVGRLWWTDKDRYIGGWKDDKKNGHGMMVWSNGDTYNGGWKDDLRHGPDCKYKYAVGGQFRGTYYYDERHGPGVYKWSDGDCFVGEWKSGGRHGKGIFISKDGTRVEQFWKEDNGISYSERQPAKFPGELIPTKE